MKVCSYLVDGLLGLRDLTASLRSWRQAFRDLQIEWFALMARLCSTSDEAMS